MSDPIRRFHSWFRAARTAGAREPEACALATVGRRGRPSLRFVLARRVDRRGFVFFTNRRSRKGREDAAHPKVALTFYWSELGRQVRVEGEAEAISDEESDAYWRTRPRESRLAAWASRQS